MEIRLPLAGGVNAQPVEKHCPPIGDSPGLASPHSCEYKTEQKPVPLFHIEVTFSTAVGGWSALALPSLPLFWGYGCGLLLEKDHLHAPYFGNNN